MSSMCSASGPPATPALNGLPPGLCWPEAATVTAVGKFLLHRRDRLHSVATKALFGQVPAADHDLAPWWDDLTARYAWATWTPAAEK
jgi:hypothetical protein